MGRARAGRQRGTPSPLAVIAVLAAHRSGTRWGGLAGPSTPSGAGAPGADPEWAPACTRPPGVRPENDSAELSELRPRAGKSVRLCKFLNFYLFLLLLSSRALPSRQADALTKCSATPRTHPPPAPPTGVKFPGSGGHFEISLRPFSDITCFP